MEESIVFSPETDESALDDEVDKTNEAFQDAGQIELEVDRSALEDLGPDGALEVEAAGGGGGGGGGGVGATGAAGLASRIPKSVSGSLAAAALPVALAGGLGIGMLSAMKSSSAQLQTQSQILGVAKDNFFREPGNVLSEAIVSPIVDSVLGISLDFDEAAREFGSAVGGDLIPPSLENAGRRMETAAEIFRTLPLPTWTDTFFAGMERAGRLLQDLGNYSLPSFEWPSKADLLDRFSWPNLGTPTWPSSTMLLGQFGAPSASALVDATFGGVRIGGRDVVDTLFGGIRIGASDLIDEVTGGGGGGGGGSSDGGGFLDGIFRGVPGLQTGGRVERTGVAQVHRGELVADPDRLVSDLADAIGTASGGGGGADMGAVESKLDTLHRDISRLASAMEQVELTVEGERLGELSKRTQASSRSNNLLTQ